MNFMLLYISMTTYSSGETFYLGRDNDGTPSTWSSFGGGFYAGVSNAPNNVLRLGKASGQQTWGGVSNSSLDKDIQIESGGTTLYIRMKSETNTFPVLIKLEGGGVGTEEHAITNTIPNVWETLAVTFTTAAQRDVIVIFPNFGNTTPESIAQFTTMRVGGSTMTLTYTNIPNGTSVNVPLDNASGLSSSVNESAISWPDTTDTTSTAPSIGSGTTITPSSLTFTNNTGSTYTAVVYLFVNTGYVGRIGGTWTNPSYLTSIAVTNQTDWGLGYNGTSPGLTSLEGFIQDCINCTTIPSGNGISIPSSVTNLSSAFKGATSFNEFVTSWDVSSVTDMSSMFEGATSYNTSLDAWGSNTANVKNMSSMFKGATSTNSVLTAWDVSSVTDMSSMFEGATSYNRSFGGWANQGTGTANVKNMSSMFKGATSYNGFVTAFDVSEVTDMSSMFEGASVYNRGVGNWNNIGSGTASVGNFSNMFKNAVAFTQYFGNINVSGAGNMSGMFEGATSIDNNANAWGSDLAGVTDMSNMFKGCTSLGTEFYMNQWDVSRVKDMSGMFEGATGFDSNTILSWTTTDLTSMANMFNGATDFNQDIRVLDASNVTDYTDMFLGATTMIANYSTTDGFGTTPSQYWFNSNTPPSPSSGYPCFLKGTMIDTTNGPVAVEDLRPYMFVRTFKHGYIPITFIGKRILPHNSKEERNRNQLFVCRKDDYPGALDDLIITGCHSLLIDRDFKDDEEKQRVIDANTDIFLTDGLFRLPAVADLQTIIYPEDGLYEIYHFALAHSDETMNYGIYANGILAETCSNRYITQFSGLSLIEK